MSIKQSDTTSIDGSRNGSFGTITSTNAITSTVATGTAPLIVTSQSLIANLNADYLNGYSDLYYKDYPSGTVTSFSQAAAPTGWTQSTTHTNKMLRVVSTAGGGSGGSHSPISMSVVPSHTHTGTTGNQSADHTHAISVTSGQISAGHVHSGNVIGSAAAWTMSDNTVQLYGTSGTGTNSVGHTHSFNATSGSQSANHTHSITTSNNTGYSNWTPKYISIINCTRS